MPFPIDHGFLFHYTFQQKNSPNFPLAHFFLSFRRAFFFPSNFRIQTANSVNFPIAPFFLPVGVRFFSLIKSKINLIPSTFRSPHFFPSCRRAVFLTSYNPNEIKFRQLSNRSIISCRRACLFFPSNSHYHKIPSTLNVLI